MKKRSPLTLIGLVILICLFSGYIIFSTHSVAGLYLGIFADPHSLLLILGSAIALYYGAFLVTLKIEKNKLQVFKLRWLQEVLLPIGIIGTLIGITLIVAGISAEGDRADFIPVLGGGLAVSLITIFYAFLLALLCYFIEKRLIVKGADEQFEPPKVKLGFNLRSIWGLLVFLGLLFGAIFSASSATGTNPAIFFNLRILCLIIAVILISIVIYGGKATIQALRLPFWRVNENDETLLAMLTAIRGNKRITAFLGFLFGLMTIISGLRMLGAATEVGFLLVNFSSILFWCLVLILFLNLAEGQVVQRIYFQTGEIHHEDRLFVVKFILPPFFLLYFLLWLVFLFLLFA